MDLKVLSEIPALIIAGAKDATAGVEDSEEFWKSGRSAGAPWTFAVEPDAAHGTDESLKEANALVIPWIKAVFSLMSADGSRQTQLTFSPSADAQPSFSPDGRRIAFWSDRDGNGDRFIMNRDGTNQRNLTQNQVVDFAPVFSPNTEEIAFQSNRDGNPEIYVMRSDGTDVRRLTSHPAADRAPDWR